MSKIHFRSINPANGHSIASYSQDDSSSIERKLAALCRAQMIWQQQDVVRRAEALLQLADALESRVDQLATLIRVHDDEEAIRLANHSLLGLASAVFSRDRKKAITIAARLEAGNVATNDFVRSDPRLSFGGIKKSGYGREHSTYGMLEFVNIKTVC
ncbi:MAG: aldehyde dehydrogenase family protein [Mariprofundus sp.]|nr:aldehyde dehydrogenase family protein [Mariprofundus sp.]